MDRQAARTSPNEQLAAIVARALSEAGLVPNRDLGDLALGLASGTMKEADWRTLLSAAIKAERRGATGAADD